ncbi:MAG: M50 family metallopeptidase [Candidatus Campbellbacteria bacterium]|nr:M50 family metallopeptidase [Candidatus Campbellbacteria bacterium]
MLGIVIFVIVLFVVIVVHEFGHFIAAKSAGIKVEEFSVGFPPRITSVKKGETLYSLGMIPIGGFVKLFGDGDENTDKPRSFRKASNFSQAATLCAGVAFNFVLGLILFTIVYMVGNYVPYDERQHSSSDISVMIVGILENSPASSFFQAGDIIKKIDVNNNVVEPKNREEVSEALKTDEEVNITYVRDNKEYNSSLSAEELEVGGVVVNAIGIQTRDVIYERYGFFSAVRESFNLVVFIVRETLIALFNLVRTFDTSQLAGPVGIAQITSQTAAFGFIPLVFFTGLLSVSIGVLNLLPIPALDGGRLLLLGVGVVMGRPVSIKTERALNGVGFLLLIALLVVVTFVDINRLF